MITSCLIFCSGWNKEVVGMLCFMILQVLVYFQVGPSLKPIHIQIFTASSVDNLWVRSRVGMKRGYDGADVLTSNFYIGSGLFFLGQYEQRKDS